MSDENKRKEYIGDKILNLGIAIKVLKNKKTFRQQIKEMYRLQSNAYLADVCREFKINVPDTEQRGFKKYADAVEIHIHNLYEEYGIDVALDWVDNYICSYKLKTETNKQIKTKKWHNK